MGWQRTVRSIASTAQKIEREAEREHQRATAFEAVQQYENYIDTITSLHKECGEYPNWEIVAEQKIPIEPKRINTNERIAYDVFENYEANLLERTFSFLKNWKIKRLKNNIEKARTRDNQEYEEASAEYKAVHKEITLAQKVIRGDAKGYIEAIDKFEPLSNIAEIGSEVQFTIDQEGYFDVALKVNAEDVIPDTIYKLTKTGKLSKREMPKSKFNELYQDHVSSCLFRVAREFFALLPIDTVYVHAIANLLDTSTGKIEEQSILSIIFTRDIMKRLDFKLIDPSDALKNLVHNLDFKKTEGFNPINKVERIRS